MAEYFYSLNQILNIIKIIMHYALCIMHYKKGVDFSMDFYSLVKEAVSKGASDIHIASGNHPAYRLHGNVIFTNGPALNEAEVTAIIKAVLNQSRFETFLQTGEADAAVEIGECGRFRANAFRQRNGTALVLRIINSVVPELSTLNLPASIKKTLDLNSGLVLVCGPTGSGKSTTLAALINELNKYKQKHIVTIEDPVEFLHTPKRCIINQREIGLDSRSYPMALRAAMREDPDIILVGEMRDRESIQIALTATETGHLVFSTVHTEGAAKTIDRLVDIFPPDQQQQIRVQLSTSLKAVISQRLLPRAGGGRIAAFEIMFCTTAISNLIRENKVANIQQSIQLGQQYGMITMSKSIDNLLAQGLITEQIARAWNFDIGDTDARR